MTINTDGGAAFPVPKSLSEGWAGMSLRDYLAAHAPAEIPEWFSHRRAPAKPPYPAHDYWTDEQYSQWRAWRDDAVEYEDITDAAVRAFIDALADHDEQMEAWQLADTWARLTQWRYAYADHMLAQRSAA